jgi:hypothetical protein
MTLIVMVWINGSVLICRDLLENLSWHWIIITFGMLCRADCLLDKGNSKDLSAFIFVLKMKALEILETLETAYQSLRRNIPKDLNVQATALWPTNAASRPYCLVNMCCYLLGSLNKSSKDYNCIDIYSTLSSMVRTNLCGWHACGCWHGAYS